VCICLHGMHGSQLIEIGIRVGEIFGFPVLPA
jgi:hypothetical protein